MIYHRSDEELEAPVQVLFSVPKKKLHKAVKRNLIRRRMSEAYRRNKHSITGHYAEGGKYLSIAFLYNGTEIMDFHEIEGNIKQLIGKIPAP
jgi:ribonuclease P protein component